MSMPVGLAGSADKTLQRALDAYRDEQGAVAALVSRKLELASQYDVEGMESAVNICFWGRSGSLLLASYLDSHDHLVMLPRNCSEFIYPFLAGFKALSVWEKLLAYPIYSELQFGLEGSFSRGDFPIAAADYYAAVHALFALYGDRPTPWLNTRARFFQLLHVAYAAAMGRRPPRTRPLIVYAQHWTND